MKFNKKFVSLLSPGLATVESKYVKDLNMGKILNPNFKVEYETLEQMVIDANKTEKKIQRKKLADPIGDSTYAIKNIKKGEFIIYGGKVIAGEGNCNLEDVTYLLQCSLPNSKWKIFVDGASHFADGKKTCANLTAHLPNANNLKFYKFSIDPHHIATANLDFEIYWAISPHGGLHILPIQRATENLPVGTLLGVDYEKEYWINLSKNGIEPCFINTQTHCPIPHTVWTLKENIIEISNDLYFSFKINNNNNVPQHLENAGIKNKLTDILTELEKKPRVINNPLVLIALPNAQKTIHDEEGIQRLCFYAKNLLDDKKYVEAINLLKPAIDEIPICSVYYLLLSYAYFHLNNRTLSKEAFQNALYLDSRIADPYVGLILNIENEKKLTSFENLFDNHLDIVNKLHQYAELIIVIPDNDTSLFEPKFKKIKKNNGLGENVQFINDKNCDNNYVSQTKKIEKKNQLNEIIVCMDSSDSDEVVFVKSIKNAALVNKNCLFPSNNKQSKSKELLNNLSMFNDEKARSQRLYNADEIKDENLFIISSENSMS